MDILPKNYGSVNKNKHIFSDPFRIITHMKSKGVSQMDPWLDPEVDLDDLIYADAQSGPSER